MINRENYEEWLLDYYEGQLNAFESEQVRLFLEAHPDLDPELEDMECLSLKQHPQKYPGKDLLKRGSHLNHGLNRSDYLLIKQVEKDLSLFEEEELEIMLKADPLIMNDQREYQFTKLKADAKNNYSGKSQLKRVVLLPFLKKSQLRQVAAVIAFFIIGGSVWLLFSPSSKQGQNMAVVETGIPGSSASTRSHEQEVVLQPGEINLAAVPPHSEKKPVSEKGNSNANRLPQNVPDKPDSNIHLALANRGVDNVIQPVKVNGYEAALNELMPLYLKSLKEKEFEANLAAQPTGNDSRQHELLANGIKVFNWLSREKIELNRRYDDAGNVVSYHLEASNLEFNHKVRK
jgi:hypothetical protein